jgi:hypothetical protein
MNGSGKLMDLRTPFSKEELGDIELFSKALERRFYESQPYCEINKSVKCIDVLVKQKFKCTSCERDHLFKECPHCFPRNIKDFCVCDGIGDLEFIEFF